MSTSDYTETTDYPPTQKHPRKFEVEAIKKEMCKTFKNISLQITFEPNKKVVDFLEITMDLRTANYKP